MTKERNIAGINPTEVWKHFADICKIPHPSFHEEKIRAHIVEFAKKHNLDYTVDEVNNIIIRKPATKGMEDRKGIILQSHLDMVPQKNSDKEFDFETDSIEAYIDGEWVKADGTTLGADNGMGVAATLAVLESTELVHGAIEGLFTATEESGMVGAFGLKGGLLKGDILINLDSEEEGELYVGCAGGLDAGITLNYTEENTKEGDKALDIVIRGLKGGHSGLEIILQRANANKVLFRFLRAAFGKFESLQLASVDAGGLRNAIPREAFAVVTLSAGDVAEFKSDLVEYEKMIVEEFKGIEDSISIVAKEGKLPAKRVDRKTAINLTNAVCCCPNGVISMSRSMEGLVQTSTNLASIKTENGVITGQCLMRSSVESEKEDVAQNISAAFELAGGSVELSGGYVGWDPNMESPILATMKKEYEAQFDVVPKVTAIHAGLECGIIGGVYPNLDMISVGPTIRFPHSPDEKVNIESVDKFWQFLVHTLEHAPKK